MTIKQAKQSQDTIHVPESSLDKDIKEIRYTILEQEKSDKQQESYKITKQIKDKETVLDQLKAEERDCMDRLDKVKKELSLIREYIDRQESEVEGLKSKKKKYDKEITMIQDTFTHDLNFDPYHL